MSEQEIYENLISWLKQSFIALVDTEETLPMIQATYTPEENSLLTGMTLEGMPSAGKSLGEPILLPRRLGAMATRPSQGSPDVAYPGNHRR